MYGDLITTVVDFDDALFCNIKGIRESQDLFDDLADDEQDALVAVTAECRDKAPSDSPLITRPFDYGAVITFPFLPHNWHQTRYSDGLSFGVWYGSRELETTVFESVFHWRQFVLDSFPDEDREILADRRVFRVRCRGILVSLVGKERAWPSLVDPNSYDFTQGVGRYLHEQNQNGLLAASARCDGINVAIFNLFVLSNPLDVCYLSYRFNPARISPVTVERERGVPWLVVER